MLCERATGTTVAALFGGLGVFSVPPFQRVFAWQEPSVTAFLEDIERCYLKRRDDSSEAHFFGSIVTGPIENTGIVRPQREVLDGQQRLAMFALFIAALSDHYCDLARELGIAGSREEEALRSRGSQIRSRYLVSKELEFSEVRDIYSLSLNQADDPFFKSLVRGEAPEPQTDSQRRLQAANGAIRSYLSHKREAAFDITEQREALNRLYRSFVEDWELVHIEAGNPKQASQIFRVLNNRGVPVSACDLLRATTLEACFRKLDDAEFEELKAAWAEMTSLEKLAPDDALEIVQSARFPMSDPARRTSSDFEASYFPQLAADIPLANQGARDLLSAVRTRRDDFLTVERLARGELIPPRRISYTSVEQSLFQSLLGELDQQWLLPIMLASRSLPQADQQRMLLNLSLFAFRYSVACNAPLEPFKRAARGTINLLNTPQPRFRFGNLEEDLRDLLAGYANDETFERALRDLTYTSDAKAVRFLLAMDEYTRAWFDEGARGRPNFRAPDQAIDLSSITLEHISAQNADDVADELQPLVHTLGNLTLLAQPENDRARNRAFLEKREIFLASNLRRNRELAHLEAWDARQVIDRQGAIIHQALRVFSLDHSRQ